MRDDLHLTYTQIGLLLSLPGIIAHSSNRSSASSAMYGSAACSSLQVAFCLQLSLVHDKCQLILSSFLLASFILFFPSSGAFVSLSQANLMDSESTRHEQNMARWTFAGSLGRSGRTSASWTCSSTLAWDGAGRTPRSPLSRPSACSRRYDICLPIQFPLRPFPSLRGGLRRIPRCVLCPQTRRCVALAPPARIRRPDDGCSCSVISLCTLSMLDVTTEAQAGIAVTVWLAMGLITDFLFIPFIDRQKDSIKYPAHHRPIGIICLCRFSAYAGLSSQAGRCDFCQPVQHRLVSHSAGTVILKPARVKAPASWRLARSPRRWQNSFPS